MAKYYRVKRDTSIPKAYRAVRDNSGTVIDYETEGISYDAGSIVDEADIDPRVLERLESDEHLQSILEEVSESDAQEARQEAKVAAQQPHLPEHSVEAYSLASDPEEPYVLKTVAEGLDERDNAEEAATLQQEAKEAANDEVPAAADERTAIDFAADKGEQDREAGEVLPVDEVVNQENPTDPDATPEPSPTPEPTPTPEPSPTPGEGEETGGPAARGRKKRSGN